MKLWWLWKRRDSELDKEIQHHLRMAEDERVERGATAEDARAGARREFGNVGLVKETSRDAWGWRWLQDFFADLRYGLRMLRQNPAFTAAAVLAIALGVGINVGIFSVLNGAALRLLPVPRAAQIVSINQAFHGHFSRNVHGEGSMFSYPEYLDYRDHNHVFLGLLAYEPFVETTLAAPRVQDLFGALTSCNYFDVLNEHPALGRGFLDSDCAAPEGNPVVVISDQLWKSTFGGDSSIIGKNITLNRTACTVVGIAPPHFTGTDVVPSSFWAPLTLQQGLDAEAHYPLDGNTSWLAMLGRAKPDVSFEQMRADLSVIAGRLDRLHHGRTTSLSIFTARFMSRPEEREVLIPIASVVLAAFGLVLLIACANVSSLLLARASARQKEIALRLSIGASRGRLVRQLLTESLLLSVAGGALGSLLAFWSFAAIARYISGHLPAQFPTLTFNLAPDLRVLGYALGISLLTGIAFGLVPALQSTRLDLNSALKAEGSQSGTGEKKGRLLRNTLVGAQIAVCMILLLAAGLLLRGLFYAQTVDPGFEMRNMSQLFLNLKAQGYGEQQATRFLRSLRQRLEGEPGILEVAQAESAPLSDDHTADHFWLDSQNAKIQIEYNHVSPEFFAAVGIPIVRGRNFGAAEGSDGNGVIVTESTARRLWPAQDPLGKLLHQSGGSQYEVIGVARDAQVSHLGKKDDLYLYFRAAPRESLRAFLLVRFAGSAASADKELRGAVQSLDPQMPVQITRMEDNLEVWRTPSRIASGVSGALGGLALLLACIGVYGMVSYSVNRSVREIGIRMALGADGSRVMAHIVRRAMRPVGIGALVGVGGCAAVSWVLSSMLFGLNALDPIAFLAVPLFLLLVALIASYVPARRVMRVDPVVALRYE
ncbi:MAG TPA: ABC transporter permease [Candidatus Acidoferrum sp.]|nr:ABC transporter permease [Candidatus Acidoferrum sp.]